MNEKLLKFWCEEGRLSEEQGVFIFDFVLEIKPKSCLEIGFFTGRSAASILVPSNPDVFVSIEHGGSWRKLPGISDHAKKYIELFHKNFPGFKIVEGNSRAVLTDSFFDEYFPDGIDFAFVDGTHNYNASNDDIRNIYPRLNNGGFLFMDDVFSIKDGEHRYPGLYRSVMEFADENSLFVQRKIFSESKTFGIIEKSVSHD